jgi:hypothetical protein
MQVDWQLVRDIVLLVGAVTTIGTGVATVIILARQERRKNPRVDPQASLELTRDMNSVPRLKIYVTNRGNQPVSVRSVYLHTDGNREWQVYDAALQTSCLVVPFDTTGFTVDGWHVRYHRYVTVVWDSGAKTTLQIADDWQVYRDWYDHVRDALDSVLEGRVGDNGQLMQFDVPYRVDSNPHKGLFDPYQSPENQYPSCAFALTEEAPEYMLKLARDYPHLFEYRRSDDRDRPPHELCWSREVMDWWKEGRPVSTLGKWQAKGLPAATEEGTEYSGQKSRCLT